MCANARFVVRVCFEPEGISYSIYEKGSGKQVEEGMLRGAEEVIISGVVFLRREGIAKSKKCLFAELGSVSVVQRGAVVSIVDSSRRKFSQ